MPVLLFGTYSMSFNLLFFHYKWNHFATTSRHLFMILYKVLLLFKQLLSHFSGYEYYYMVWIIYMYNLHNKAPIQSVLQILITSEESIFFLLERILGSQRAFIALNFSQTYPETSLSHRRTLNVFYIVIATCNVL